MDLFSGLIINIKFTKTPCLAQHWCSIYLQLEVSPPVKSEKLQRVLKVGKKKNEHCTFLALHKTMMIQLGKIPLT